MIHSTHITYDFPGDPLDGTTQCWVSLDGDHWLPVSRDPVESDEEAIREMFEGDGNFKPLTFGTSYLVHLGADL